MDINPVIVGKAGLILIIDIQMDVSLVIVPKENHSTLNNWHSNRYKPNHCLQGGPTLNN